MRIPDHRALARQAEPPKPINAYADGWERGRDVAPATRAVRRKALRHVIDQFGDRDPSSLTWQEIDDWLDGLAKRYTRGTCQKILGALRGVLDRADVSPNPARDPRVKLPSEERSEVEPPSAKEVRAIVERAAPRYRLAPAAVRNAIVRLRVRCLLDRICAGTLLLRPRTGVAARAAETTSYGSARFRIGARRSATLRVRLSKAGRSALKRGRSVAVKAVVNADGGRWTLKLTLKR
jgi:hypothetical protein